MDLELRLLKLFDNWNQFVSNENSSVYGTEYNYTTMEGQDEISSGVASYEPINSGGDEIALRKPHFYYHYEVGIPTERFYTEYPLNEEIFATQDIRYSEVRTRSIEYNDLSSNTTGYAVHKHFTSRDFPLRTKHTDVEAIHIKPSLQLFDNSVRRFGLSFGSSIISNDMHGKFKSKHVYTANGNEVYKMVHHYKIDGDGNLDNEVVGINPDGTKNEHRLMGVITDLLTYLGKSESHEKTIGLKAQLEYTAPFIFVPSVWPGPLKKSEVSLYTSLTTKVIFQTGILERIDVEDNGVNNYVENSMYDVQTGAPIVTKVSPEHGDGKQYVYQYDFPAYWAYPNMGMASDNAGIRRTNITGSGSVVTNQQKPYFSPGDELMVSDMLQAFR